MVEQSAKLEERIAKVSRKSNKEPNIDSIISRISSLASSIEFCQNMEEIDAMAYAAFCHCIGEEVSMFDFMTAIDRLTSSGDSGRKAAFSSIFNAVGFNDIPTKDKLEFMKESEKNKAVGIIAGNMAKYTLENKGKRASCVEEYMSDMDALAEKISDSLANEQLFDYPAKRVFSLILSIKFLSSHDNIPVYGMNKQATDSLNPDMLEEILRSIWKDNKDRD
jgi:hypothetical protein